MPNKLLHAPTLFCSESGLSTWHDRTSTGQWKEHVPNYVFLLYPSLSGAKMLGEVDRRCGRRFRRAGEVNSGRPVSRDSSRQATLLKTSLKIFSALSCLSVILLDSMHASHFDSCSSERAPRKQALPSFPCIAFPSAHQPSAADHVMFQ